MANLDKETDTNSNFNTNMNNALFSYEKPTFISYKNKKFVIISAPTNSNLNFYLDLFKKHNVKIVVRTCESTYDSSKITELDIHYVDLQFIDGQYPPTNIVNIWLSLVMEFSLKPDECICIHCISGLGRAPTLVVLAFIELGMDIFDAVKYVRKKRPGSINTTQLKFLESYKAKYKKRLSCIIC
jgi:protein tyrosine phosphatase type 4A